MPRSLAGGRTGAVGLLGGAIEAGVSVEGNAMPDRATFSRPADPPRVFDELEGTYSDAAPTVVASGLDCRIGPAPAMPRGHAITVADQSVAVLRWLCSVPLTAPHFVVGDTVTVTTSHDPGLLGEYVIVDVGQSTSATARRLLLEHPTGESPRDQ